MTEEFIINAEKYDMRCLPRYTDSVYDESSSDKMDTNGCMFFIYLAIIGTKYPEILKKYFNPQIGV